MDWIDRNHRSVSVQRLQELHGLGGGREFPLGTVYLLFLIGLLCPNTVLHLSPLSQVMFHFAGSPLLSVAKMDIHNLTIYNTWNVTMVVLFCIPGLDQQNSLTRSTTPKCPTGSSSAGCSTWFAVPTN